jgi:hypothetical protein|tara:strand:- start:280 stop:537 length:258 start_codon:yes stop_codon:yes gene_type:complete
LNFPTDKHNDLGITHLFAYEAQPVLRGWLNARMEDEIIFKPQNISPNALTSIAPKALEFFEHRYAKEIALHARVTQVGGHLITAI